MIFRRDTSFCGIGGMSLGDDLPQMMGFVVMDADVTGDIKKSAFAAEPKVL